MPSPQAICEILWSIAVATALGGAAFGFGRPVLRQLKLPRADPLFVTVWSVALGLACGGTLLLVLAAAGWVYSPVIAGITLAANFWTLVELACIYLAADTGHFISAATANECAPPSSPPPRGSLFAALLAGLVLLFSLVVALAPTTSAEVISGSLALPKEMLLEHGFSGGLFVGSAPPNLVQMWYVCALALDGPVAAALVHWGIGVLMALATVLAAQEFLPSGYARFAGCLALLCPGVQYQLGLPLADLGLAVFCALALAALGRIVVHLEMTGWPIAGGLMLGGAIATMPAGLAFAAALGLVGAYVYGSASESRREFAEAGRTFLGVTLVTAGPWLFFLGFFLNRSAERQSLHSIAAPPGPLDPAGPGTVAGRSPFARPQPGDGRCDRVYRLVARESLAGSLVVAADSARRASGGLGLARDSETATTGDRNDLHRGRVACPGPGSRPLDGRGRLLGRGHRLAAAR